MYAVPGERLFLLQYPDRAQDEIVQRTEVDALRRLQQRGRLVGGRLWELTVPPGHYFVVGDNSKVSGDGRSFGCLPEEAILGRLAL